MSALHELTLAQLRASLAAKDVSAREATQAALERIQATEPKVAALLSVQAQQALDTAAALDAAGPDASKPLWGVPLTIKDALCTKGVPTTAGSRILENFVPPFDATAVARLRQAGAVILGKNNLDEFAMGSSTENSAYQQTHNPWALDRVPGGSSGGSAASVAAGQCYGSLGTDTGGSIRLPASFCGIVGLKPTYGRVSRYGLIAYGSSLDQIGPLARSVEDAALLLSAIAGPDPRDSTCAEEPLADYLGAATTPGDLKGLRIGMPAEYWPEAGAGVDPEVRAACQQALDAAKALGAELVPVDLPHTRYSIATYYIVAMAEASSNLSRFDGVRYGLRDESAANLLDMYRKSRSLGFGEEVKRRILIGTYVLSSGYYDAYYRKAAQVRRLIRQDFEQALTKCDVIAGPACPSVAFKLGDKTADPLQMYLMDIFTVSVNLAGVPGMSLPVGLGADSGMPVGLQLIGRPFGEADLLRVASRLEHAMGATTGGPKVAPL